MHNQLSLPLTCKAPLLSNGVSRNSRTNVLKQCTRITSCKKFREQEIHVFNAYVIMLAAGHGAPELAINDATLATCGVAAVPGNIQVLVQLLNV